MTNMNPTALRDVQVPIIVALVAISVGYVLFGGFFVDHLSEFQIELMQELKVVVVAGILASFALLGLGRRASVDKPPT